MFQKRWRKSLERCFGLRGSSAPSRQSVRRWREVAAVFAGAAVCGGPLYAQQPGGSGGPQTPSAVQLPSSGRNQSVGAVSAQQMTSQGSGAMVVQPSVNVMGTYSGSVVQPGQLPNPLQLSLADAVQRGLRANLGIITAATSSYQSGTQRSQALSQLLPQISLEAQATETQINLAAYGLSSLSGGGGALSAGLPEIIGPFHYVQGQANLNWQNVSVTNYRNLQVAKQVDTAARLSLRDAREMVILAVGGTYMQIAAAAARVDAQALQVKYAQATYDQAKTRLEAGTNTRIDMTRSLVQLQTEQERLISLQSDLDQQKIAFARLIGVPQSSTLVLSDPLGVAGVTPPEADAELKLARANRQDLKAAEAQVRAGEEAASGARAERVPSFSFTGYYGANGPTPTQSHGVFSATGTINVPIFDGGKIRADVDQAQSTLRQRKAEYADLQGQVEQQVRNALVQLRAAIGQVKLAQSNREYALETLQQAQDRFEAGVTTTVEVVQAQQGEGSAENDYINGLFAYDLARLSLARATGQAETDFNSILGESHP